MYPTEFGFTKRFTLHLTVASLFWCNFYVYNACNYYLSAFLLILWFYLKCACNEHIVFCDVFLCCLSVVHPMGYYALCYTVQTEHT
jgi:hypothetical protein